MRCCSHQRSSTTLTVRPLPSCAGFGTILAFKLIGYLTDANQSRATHSFDSIIIVSGLVPFLGMILVLMLVRNNRATRRGLVRPI